MKKPVSRPWLDVQRRALKFAEQHKCALYRHASLTWISDYLRYAWSQGFAAGRNAQRRIQRKKRKL